MKDKGLTTPFMLSRDNKLELGDYLKTGYAKSLKVELHELVTAKKITSLQKQLVMAIKADEYYRHCVKGTAWGSVKCYLENFPELFTLHDLFFKEESTEKYFFIINSYSEEEFEKIVSYQKLDFKKHRRELPNGKFINIYTIYLELSEQHPLESHPVRKVWGIAESSGIRVGFHNYRSRHFMNRS